MTQRSTSALMPTVLDDRCIDRYLRRIEFEQTRAEIVADLATLEALMLAHLVAVPFENLDVFHQQPVQTDLEWSLAKILDRRRGGWCFELNGAFGSLLASLGFDVRYLGAAVLLTGPNSTLDHLTLEVTIDQPYLVDVGFGDSFLRPLALNDASEQVTASGTYQFIPSPIGTTLAKLVDDVPEAHHRFKRVAHRLRDFDAASTALAADPDGHFRKGPVVTRLLDAEGRRVTLSADRLVVRDRSGQEETSETITSDIWWPMVREWFGIHGPISPNQAGS